MRIAVLGGGGALGGLFGGTLAAGGHDVTLVDVSIEAVEAINRNGLLIEDMSGAVTRHSVVATTSPSDTGEVDLVLVLVKGRNTEDAVRAAVPMRTSDTVFLTLQNGWGNAEAIARIVGERHLLVGLTYQAANLLAPGRVRHAKSQTTLIGEPKGHRTARLNDVVRGFNQAGLEAASSDRIIEEVWKKLALNIITLPTSAVLRITAEALMQHHGTRQLMRTLLAETVTVARAADIPLDEEERWETLSQQIKSYIGVKSSMLQDVEAGRLTEIDFINGAVVETGRRHGIATPVNEAMVHLVKTIEERYTPTLAGG